MTKFCSAINLDDKTKQIKKPWIPIEVARFNDQVIRLALFDGEYHWHKHDDEDELFYIYKGKIAIQLKNRSDIILNEGQMAIIPKGDEHCPKSLEPSYVIMVEPSILKSRGS